MSELASSWVNISRVFNQDNPRHVSLHAGMVAESATEDTIVKLNSLLSALRRFPEEILAEIFMICVAHVKGHLIYEPGAPWVLGQICSRWRQIALTTPRLWCDIVISLDDRPVPKGLIKRVELLLQRSRKHSLTVYVDCEAYLDSHPALDLLMSQSHRWADVELYIPVTMLMGLGPIRERLHSLHTLDITIYPLVGDVDVPPTLTVFSNAPLLRSFTFWDDIIPVIVIPVPSTHLTTYSSRSEDFAVFLTGLRSMQNLVECRIEPRNYVAGPQTEVHLPQLRILSIKETDEPTGHAGSFLDCLTLPQLHNLECTNGVMLPHLIALVARSSCSLRTFSLAMRRPTAQITSKALKFFERTPTIVSLTLAASQLTPNFVKGLTRGAASQPCVLPALRMLYIDAAFSAREVISMVNSRIHANSEPDRVPENLPGLRVYLVTMRCGLVDDSARKVLCELKERGLPVFGMM
ncbi:hypothetical protein DFH09DRAFT_981714 [Mycena vulgaris]|nr:hypothetical protein DFH09DRAFT_981714 [Mycena vulgaris]